MESDYHWLITVGLVTSSVIAVTANSFLLLVFCRRRGLRTVPNRFVINLLVTNLLSSILLIPLLLVDQGPSAEELAILTNNSVSELIIEEDILSDPTTNSIAIIQTSDIITQPLRARHNGTNSLLMCYLAQSTTSFICTVSIFSILLIGINQYFGVMHSLRYHFYVNRCRSSILIGMSWFVALFFAILSSLTYSDSSVWHFCSDRTEPSVTIKIINTVYSFSYFFLVILTPFIAICVIYVCIYSAAHKNSERMRRSASAPLNPNQDCVQVPILKESSQSKGSNPLPKVHSAPNFSNLVGESKAFIMESVVADNLSKEQKVCGTVTRTPSDRSSNSFITNLRHKISNASVFRYREETRAAKISILVIFMVLVCYVPYGLTLILSSKCIRYNTCQIFNNLSLVLLVLSNIISPFLFGYRNKRVKREIGKMCGFSSSSKKLNIPDRPRRPSTEAKRSFENVHENFDHICSDSRIHKNAVIPEVIVTCKPENERKSILKRVCNTSTWTSYKKCNFITVPDSCISGEARGSFSSASTQISIEE